MTARNEFLAWFAGIPSDLRVSFRRLVRRPAFTVSAILIFGLGTGFSTALAGVYQALFLRPLPYADETHLLGVISTFGEKNGIPQEFATSGFDYTRWLESRSLVSAGALTPQDVSVLLGDRLERVKAEAVTASLFATLGTRPILGRLPTEDDERQGADVVTLGWDFWARRMGADSSLVGGTLRIDGRPHVVIGVMPRGFTTLFQSSDFYLPLVLTAGNQTPSGRRIFAVTARAAPGVTREQAQSELRDISRRLAVEFPDTDKGWDVLVKPLRERYFGNRRPVFRLLIAGVGLVLLIGCANLAHLSLATAVARRPEFALRTVLGAGRAQLLRQQGVESLLLALGGGGVGLAVAAAAIRLLLGIDPEIARLAGQVSLSLPLAGFALLVAIVASFLGSALPSALMTATAAALRAGTRSSGSVRDRVLRQGMLAGEVALGMILLLGGGVVVGGLLAAMREDPGFEPAGLVAAEVVLPASRYGEPVTRAAFVDQLLGRLRGAPGITAATVTMTRFRPGMSMSSLVSGEGAAGDPAVPLAVNFRRIAPGYLATTRARLVAGREFTEADNADAPRVSLISESMARRYWPGQDPIGRRFKRPPTSADWTTVVGVVGDVRDSGPGFDLGPTVYVPYAQNSAAGVAFAPVTVVLRTARPTGDAATLLRQTIAALDPDLAGEAPMSVEQHLAGALAPQRFQAMLVGAFALTALLLVAAGLYGVTAYGVSQRRKEIGI
ncbi:MAG: hypothetical protein HOP28_08555, partial [Gemmatimonadales bacterium]|nr:hypothetical protein [Gemmatimonadales bacterium]